MKYIIVLGDGMSDYPIPELGGKTPLQAARKPGMDFIAQNGILGLVHTIPDNVSTGSDTANLSVLGFNPEIYYTGRAPIEAVSMGLTLGDGDIAYRCNLVNLSGAPKYEDKVMVDYSSDEIPSAEAAELIEAVNGWLPERLTGIIKFHPGISYRHCMVWLGGGENPLCTPPHDILTRRIGGYLPADTDGSGDARILNELMRESFDFLSVQEVNRSREKRGLLQANSLWLWGQGRRLSLPSFSDKYGISGAVISAVDLIKGIGLSAGLRSIDVKGATGTLNTNYRGKAEAALAALDGGCDLVYVHVEAPDECGHRHETENKVKSIEYIDENVVLTILDHYKQKGGDFTILVIPDHATPLSLRTHTRDPVPFAVYSNASPEGGGWDKLVAGLQAGARGAAYDEMEAAKTGVVVNPGYTLMDYFLQGSVTGIC